jgi:hypothetical protein
VINENVKKGEGQENIDIMPSKGCHTCGEWDAAGFCMWLEQGSNRGSYRPRVPEPYLRH